MVTYLVMKIKVCGILMVVVMYRKEWKSMENLCILVVAEWYRIW